jgi:photosystem II stability/assembly factor-like uncharacterized protein
MKTNPGRTIGLATGVALGLLSLALTCVNAQTPFEYQPVITWHGRTVAVTICPTNTFEAIAATESGGLFKTLDGGVTWFHLDNLPMFRMEDVKYAPPTAGAQSLVIATGHSDTHTQNQGGIWRSTDGGQTWSRPTFNYACNARENDYEIAFDYGQTYSNIYVGAQCGLAYSQDGGATFSLALSGNTIYCVAVPAPQILDVVGAQGHQRSYIGYSEFMPPDDTRVPQAVHGLAASPVEPGVIFVASASGVNASLNTNPCSGQLVAVFEGDYQTNGSVVWTQVSPSICNVSRGCWVATNPSADGNTNDFDIYFGAGETMWRQTVTQRGGTGPRCFPLFALPPFINQGWYPVTADHTDFNDIAFSTAPGNNCAQFLASDGGVHITTDCGATWTITGQVYQPGFFGLPFPVNYPDGFNALQIYDIDGQMDLVEPTPHVDLYIAMQDNALWASADGGQIWPYTTGADDYLLQVSRYAISDQCCQTVAWGEPGFNGGTKTSLPLFAPSVATWGNPPGPVLALPSLASSTLNGVQVFTQWATNNTLAVTTDGGNNWQTYVLDGGLIGLLTLVGTPHFAVSNNAITIYQPYKQSGANPDGDSKIGLLRITGLFTDGTVGNTDVELADTGLGSLGSFCNGEGTFICPVVFGVDPNDPSHLIAPDVESHQIMVSTNGGGNWAPDTNLTTLVTQTNAFLFDAADIPGIGSVLQVHMIAFNPYHQGDILVGTEATGLFRSTDNGASWYALPNSTPVTAANDVFFIDDGKDGTNQYSDAIISTYGRGLWKIALTPPPTISFVPFNWPAGVIASLESNCWLQSPTGDCMNQIPTNCIECINHIVDGGIITGLLVNSSNVVTKIFINGGRLVVSTGNGLPVNSFVDLAVSSNVLEFDNCPQCTYLATHGAAVTGVLLDGAGHLIGIYGGAGTMPGLSNVDFFEPPLNALADLPEVSAPMQPYLFLTGTEVTGTLVPTAAIGDMVGASGSGFCGDPSCPPVVLTLDDGTVLTNSQIDSDGNFQTSFMVPLAEPRGPHTVTATQQPPSSPVLQDFATLLVVKGDDSDEDQPPAQLGIAVNAMNTTLYWPLSQQGYLIQWAPSLTPPIAWQTNPANIVVKGDYYTATVQPTNSQGFFRIVAFANPAAAPSVTTYPATLVSSNSAQMNGAVNPNDADATYWFEYGNDTNYTGGTTASAVISFANSSPVAVFNALSGLALSTTYHYQLVAGNIYGISYGGDQQFTTTSGAPPPPPLLVTQAATSLSQTSAVLNGTLDGNGSEAVGHFRYGLDTNYTSGQVGTYFTSFTGDVEPYSFTLTGLTPSTTYHFQTFGFNCCAEGFGGDVTFTTLAIPAPTVSTLAASSVTETAATLNGSVNPNGFSTTVYFEWGTTTGYGNITTQTGIGTTPQSDFQASLSGLSSFTTYHYRMDAVNGGDTSLGADNSFTTAWMPVPPTLLSPGTSSPGSPSIVGTLTPTFTWTGASQASSYDLAIQTYPGGGTVFTGSVGGTSFSSLPGGTLAAGTEYHWFMVSFNSLGDESADSSSLYFQTASAPSVTTVTATNLTSVSAVLEGSVNPNGASTTAYFEYGTTTNYGSITTQTGIGTTPQSNFQGSVSGLNPFTTYHYRIDALNAIGSSQGADKTFKTLD